MIHVYLNDSSIICETLNSFHLNNKTSTYTSLNYRKYVLHGVYDKSLNFCMNF